MLPEPPAVLKLTFNEPVSPLVMRLIGPSGEVIVPAAAAENNVVTLTPPRLRQGTHVLSWRVVSADGHPVGGSVIFSVGTTTQPVAGPESASDPMVRTALWAMKVVIYAGLFFGAGGAFFRAWFGAGGARPALLTGSLAAALVAALVSVGLQGLDALDLRLSELVQAAAWRAGFATAYGLTAVAAAVALFAALCSLAVSSRLVARGLSLVGLVGI